MKLPTSDEVISLRLLLAISGVFDATAPVHCRDGPGRVVSRAGAFIGKFDGAERAGALGLTTKQPEITKNALRICPLHTTRAGLEAVGFRVRRLPVGFCLRFFVFLLSRVVPDKTTS